MHANPATVLEGGKLHLERGVELQVWGRAPCLSGPMVAAYGTLVSYAKVKLYHRALTGESSVK